MTTSDAIAGIAGMLNMRRFHIKETIKHLEDNNVGIQYKVPQDRVFIELHDTVRVSVLAHLRGELAEIEKEIKELYKDYKASSL